MKHAHFLTVLALMAAVLFAAGATVASAQDDNPWSSGGNDPGSGTSGTGGSSDPGSGTSGSGTSGSGSGNSGMSGNSGNSGGNDNSGFNSGGNASRTAEAEAPGVIRAPVSKFGLGLRTWDFTADSGVGAGLAAGPELRYWLDPGFALNGALAINIRAFDGGNAEFTFALSFGTFITLVDAAPVFIELGQRLAFGIVANPGGATGDRSGLMFEFPIMAEFFLTPQFSFHVEFGIQIHVVTSGTGVFAGSAGTFGGTGTGFALSIGRSGTLLGNAGFTFYF